jgi:uncharacterized protein (TIGR02145 family)
MLKIKTSDEIYDPVKYIVFTGLALVTFILMPSGPLEAQTEPLVYQFVVRDQNGEPVDNESLEVDLTILEGGLEDGKAVYREFHDITTSDAGLVRLQIGGGSSEQDFSTITWNIHRSYFVRVRVENLMNSGYDYQHTSELVMISPEVFTGTLEELSDNRIDTTGVDLKALSIKDNKVYLSNGGVIELPDFFKDVNSLLIKADKEDVSCYGRKDGSIDLSVEGGFPPYSYRWSDGQTSQDLDNLKAGDYRVYVKDSKGYTAIKQISIDQPDPLKARASIGMVSSIGAEDGTIQLHPSGGRPPYDYQWSTGDTTRKLSHLAPGEYEVTIQASGPCSLRKEFVVKEPIALTFDKQNVRCYNEKNGSVRVNIQGGNPPYRINWSNRKSGRQIENLAAGRYYVSVKDSWGTQVVDSVNILQPYPLQVQDSVIHINEDQEGGEILLKVEGGIPPYHYKWSSGDTTQNLRNIKNGVYSVTVEDSRGCLKRRDQISVYSIMEDPRDSQQYRVITIAGQKWMGENLNVGEQLSTNEMAMQNDRIEKFCYNNSRENCRALGGLYTWDEAMQYNRPANKEDDNVQGICPDGWHIPSEKEWQELSEHLGGEMVAGNKLKDWRYWDQSVLKNKNQIDLKATGFAALPAGRIDISGESHYKGVSTSFWSASQSGSDKAWHRTITTRGSGLYHDASYTTQKFSVRCIKDQERKHQESTQKNEN